MTKALTALLGFGLLAVGWPVRAAEPAYNVALGKSVYGTLNAYAAPGHRGTPHAALRRLTDGVFAGTGASFGSPRALVLGPYSGHAPELPLDQLPDDLRRTITQTSCLLEVDLGGLYPLGWVALEADAEADYRVEYSRDGRFWRTLWTAPAAFGRRGFETRRSDDFEPLISARFLRVGGAMTYQDNRPAGVFGRTTQRRFQYAVGELQAYTRSGADLPDRQWRGLDPVR